MMFGLEYQDDRKSQSEAGSHPKIANLGRNAAETRATHLDLAIKVAVYSGEPTFDLPATGFIPVVLGILHYSLFPVVP